jgi:hypothetical protein
MGSYRSSVIWRHVYDRDKKKWRKRFVIMNLIYLVVIGLISNELVKEYNKEVQIVQLSEKNDEYKTRHEILGILRLKGLSLSQGMDIADVTISQCKELKLPLELPLAIMKKETGFVNYAVSHKGAMGIMQLMPATFDIYNKSLNLGLTRQAGFDPIVNIRIATHYLKDLYNEFKPTVKTEAELWKKVLHQYSGGANGYSESVKKFSKEYESQITKIK